MSDSDWAFLVVSVAPIFIFLGGLYLPELRKAFEGIWRGLKSIVVAALDLMFGFSARENERRLNDAFVRFTAVTERLQEQKRSLALENAKLRETYALLLDGTPGAVKDAPEKPQVPAWGTPEPVEAILPATAADERYVRRLERERTELQEKVQNYQIMAGRLTEERDRLQKQLQPFKNLVDGDPQSILDYVEHIERHLKRYKQQVEIAEGIATRATERMERYGEEVERLSREVGRMQTDGVMPMATFTDNEPSITMLSKQWEHEYARPIKETRVISSEIPSGEYPYEVVNTIEHQDGTVDVFFRFALDGGIEAQDIARRMMIEQCAKSRLMAISSTLHEDVVMSRAETRMLSYTYRYKAQRVTFQQQG